VIKDFGPRGWLIRKTLGRWLIGRELRAYRTLADVEAVPQLLGRVDVLAFALEYRPGQVLSRSLAGTLPDGFLAELRAAVEAMHARGVVHLDLRHRSNILATEDGHPVLIDFASSLRFAPGSVLGRGLRACVAWVDLRALGKWEQRLGSDAGIAGR
jgi:serine/threonine protein kinase